MNCLDCGTVLPRAGATCPNCHKGLKGLQEHLRNPIILAGLAGVVLFFGAILAIRSYQHGQDKEKQDVEVRQLCEELGPELRNKPPQDVVARLGQPVRKTEHKSYEAWIYTASEGGQFAVLIYGGKVSRITPGIPTD